MKDNKGLLAKTMHLILTNVGGMVGLSIYILVDTMFVANGIGENGLAALNLAIPVYKIVYAIGLLIGVGGATVYQIKRSCGKQAEGDKAYTASIWLGGFFGVISLLSGFFLTEPICSAMADSEILAQMSAEYVRVLFFFGWAFIFNNIFMNFLRNDGAPNFAMAMMALGSVLNIVLDYIFIYPLKWGMFGAIFASGLAQTVSVAAEIVFMLAKKRGFSFVRCRASFRELAAVISPGWAAFLNEALSGTVVMLFNFMVMKHAGSDGIIAYGVITNLAIMVNSVLTGIAQGVQPVISECCGKGSTSDMVKVRRLGLTVSIISGIIMYLLFNIFARQLTMIFISSSTESLISMTAEAVRVYFVGYIFAALGIYISAYFSAAEEPVKGLVLSLTRGAAAVIPALFIMAAVWGINGVWASFPAAEFITAAVAFAMVLIADKKRNEKV
ncbi:MAG: MATE family efflux transporter [Huintestinicola sp.]